MSLLFINNVNTCKNNNTKATANNIKNEITKFIKKSLFSKIYIFTSKQKYICDFPPQDLPTNVELVKINDTHNNAKSIYDEIFRQISVKNKKASKDAAILFCREKITNISEFNKILKQMKLIQLNLDSETQKIEPMSSNTSMKTLIKPNGFEGIVGVGRKLGEILNNASQASNTASPVIIEGEYGTGKRLLANLIGKNYHNHTKENSCPSGGHEFKPASARHFQSLQSPSSQNIESFNWHLEGPMAINKLTGDLMIVPGETISTGILDDNDLTTLILEDIDKCSLEAQYSILTLLKNFSSPHYTIHYSPLKDNIIKNKSVKIIATSTQDLISLVEKGQFLPDLYFKLAEIKISMIPLQYRSEEIPLLANHFLEKYNHKNHTKKQFSTQAMKMLKKYRWPGNITELKLIIRQACLFSCKNDIISPENLQINKNTFTRKDTLRSNFSLPEEVEKLEKYYIIKALKQANGVQKEAAQILGLNSPVTLHKKMEKYKISKD